MPIAHNKAKLVSILLKFADAALVILIFFCTVEYARSGDIFNFDLFRRIELFVWHFFVILMLAVLVNRIFVRMGMYNFRQLGGIGQSDLATKHSLLFRSGNRNLCC